MDIITFIDGAFLVSNICHYNDALADDEDIICTAHGRLKEQDKELFYDRLRPLKKCWPKYISFAADYVKVTKCDVPIHIL